MPTSKKWPQHLHTRTFEFLWNAVVELVWFYFRVRVRGEENLPENGPYIVIANHSGYAGADAVLLAHHLHLKTGRFTHIMAHDAYFKVSKRVNLAAKSFGLIEASFKSGGKAIRDQSPLLIFPEAEVGNFKSFWKKYKLQRFHTGFLRIAIQEGVPVIPVVILGAEESFINLGSINLNRVAKHLRIPLPLNFIPLPARWSIRFLEPLDLSKYHRSDATDREKMREGVKEVRNRLQQALDHELKNRKSIFAPLNWRSFLRAGEKTR